jgi:hypothetical protein
MIEAIKRWMFGNSPRVVRRDVELEDRYRAELALIQDGWRPWFSPIGPQPWDYAVIEIRTLDTQAKITVYQILPKDMSGNGLYWRPWTGSTLPGEYVTLN